MAECGGDDRLLAAIRETEDARALASSAAAYLKGKELIHLTASDPPANMEQRHQKTPPVDDDASTTRAPEFEQAANRQRAQGPKRPFMRPFMPFMQHTAGQGATTRIAKTAKSTMRAAGAAVTNFGAKLWVAAGKALSEEVRSMAEADVSHQTGAKVEQDRPSKPQRQWRRFFARFHGGGSSEEAHEPHASSEQDRFAQFFEEACRQRGGEDCSQESKTAYGLLQESRRQQVHLLEANLWAGLLAKRLETARTKPHLAYVSEAVWTLGKWAGMFVQDAHTEMEMRLELKMLSPDGSCSGLITWANGLSVTEFDGNVLGNQVNFEEVRVVSDRSGGEFVPGTRYRLWKDGGNGPGMEGTWMHPTLMVWGYLNLKAVAEDALMRTAADKQDVADAAASRTFGPSIVTRVTATATATAAEPAGLVTPAAASMRQAKAIGTVDSGVWITLACALMLTLVVLPSWTNAGLRKSCDCLRAVWEFVTGCAGSRKERPGVKQASAGASASKPRIDIPAEAFRAAGRSVLRNSAASISSPISR
jgi:hypothetical protein